MKPLPIVLLVISLAGNAALFTHAARQPALARVDHTASSPSTQPVADPKPLVATADRGPATPARTTDSAPSWSQLATSDLSTLARQLAEAGFPRAAIVAVVNEQIAARQRALRQQFSPDESALPYWRSSNRPRDGAFVEMSLATQKEDLALRRQVLGPDWMLEDESEVTRLVRTYGVTDRAKLAALVAIVEDYNQVGREMAIEDRAGGTSNELRRESQEMLNREQLADIQALLTPEEFAEYQLRAGPTARALRNSLRHFQASEAEYRALFAAYQSSGDTLPGRFNPGQLVAAARAVLAPERLADLQQATAPGAQRLNQFATRFNLPLSSVAPVQAAQRDATSRANVIRRDATITDAERQARLAALATEAAQKVTAALGEHTFAAYREYDGGWISGLTSSGDSPRP